MCTQTGACITNLSPSQILTHKPVSTSVVVMNYVNAVLTPSILSRWHQSTAGNLDMDRTGPWHGHGLHECTCMVLCKLIQANI